MRSNFGETQQNNSGAVICGADNIAMPIGGASQALNCTVGTQVPSSFRQGISAPLTAGQTYTISFFFRDGMFTNPYGQQADEAGVSIVGAGNGAGTPLVTTDPYPNGWYRQRLSYVPTVSQIYQMGIIHTINRAPGEYYWIYGFQLEYGTKVTPYVPQ